MVLLPCFSDDEQFFRSLHREKNLKPEQKIYHWEIWGNVFRYDLDGDGSWEGLQMVKKDQEDWFYIRRDNGLVLGKFKLDSKGRESRGYRVKIYSLGQFLKLLTLSFYSGFTESQEFYGTSRLYFVTFSTTDITSSLTFSKGPAIWLEQRTRTSYVQANYGMKVEDLNRDGISEFILHRGSLRRVFQYFPGKGMIRL